MKPDDPPVMPTETTGLPGLRSWPAVYLVVLGTLVLWIVLLAALTRGFS